MSYYTLRYSGGGSNSSSSLSLGGDISSVIITNPTYLFSNISVDEAIAGKTDYRCIYAYNSSGFNLGNSKILLPPQVIDGSTVKIGIKYATEEQIIKIKGYVTGGTLNITYTHYDGTPITFYSNFQSPPESWAASMQNSLRTLTGWSGITVEVSQSQTSAIPLETAFHVKFLGDGNNRYHNTMQVQSNLINCLDATVSKMIDGSPINTKAQLITNEKTSPLNMVFSNGILPLTIGNIRKNEYFPLWLQRNTPVNSNPKLNDGFTLRIQSDSATV